MKVKSKLNTIMTRHFSYVVKVLNINTLSCWNYKKIIEKTSEATNSQRCVASKSDDGEILCADASITSKENSLTYVWVLDLGATWQMTSRRDWFYSYKSIPKLYVFMGDDCALKIVGIGAIKLMMHGGIVRTIQEVRHVKVLKKNLLSIGQFDDLGLKAQIKNGIMKVVKGAFIMMKEKKTSSKLFVL